MVKPTTRREIQRLATELNFAPHPGARVLRRSSPAPIAVLLPRKENIFLSEYYARLLMGIMHNTSSKGQAVYAMAFKPKPEDFIAQLNAVSVGCDGIIYLSDSLTPEMSASLAKLHQPFVCPTSCLATNVSESCVGAPVFGLNDLMGGRIATEYLISLGHRRIAFLAGPANKRDAQERRRGFEQAMRRKKLELHPEWIVEAAYTFQAGVDVAWQFKSLIKKEGVTAVVCTSDEAALGLMHELNVMKIRCPRDVSIIGYDDLQWSSRYAPSLSTIRQPFMDMATAAVEMVAEQQGGEVKKADVPDRLFEPTLIIRESTTAP